MKKTLIVFLALIFLFMLGGIILFIFFHASTKIVTTTNNASLFQDNASISPEQQKSNKEIQQSFLGSIQNANQITLLKTVIVSTYALQTWVDTNKGGEALLEYSNTSGWVLVSMGGGAWDVNSLVDEGVPQNIAVQLIAQEQ